MTYEPKRTIGRRILQIRTERRLSQEELADACGYNRTYLGALERGERNLTNDTLMGLAERLGVHVFELLMPDQDDVKNDPQLRQILVEWQVGRS